MGGDRSHHTLTLNTVCGILVEVDGDDVLAVHHPDDAAAAGLADDQALIVRSEHGELTGVAKVDAVS